MSPGTSLKDDIKIPLFTFISCQSYQGAPLDPRIISYFLKALAEIRRIGDGQGNLWSVTREGAIDQQKLGDLISHGRVPREYQRK
jgi:hypothetical protein